MVHFALAKKSTVIYIFKKIMKLLYTNNYHQNTIIFVNFSFKIFPLFGFDTNLTKFRRQFLHFTIPNKN